MAVRVVTDSSSCLPAEWAKRWAIRQVPLHVLLDGVDWCDGIDAIPDDIHQRERASTSGPAPAELLDAYRRALADSGGDGVVAVHLSSELSGTFGTARRIAAELSGPVRVVDSKSTAMGTGFIALAAARAAAGGAGLDAVAAAAEAAVSRTVAYIVVRRLDNLRRSGRIGSAAAWLGTALSIKPLLTIVDGKLVLAQRIRTTGKAIAAMVERVCDVVGDRSLALAVHHVADPDGAAALAATLADRLPDCAPALVSDLCPALALHVGAGALAVVIDETGEVASGPDLRI